MILPTIWKNNPNVPNISKPPTRMSLADFLGKNTSRGMSQLVPPAMPCQATERHHHKSNEDGAHQRCPPAAISKPPNHLVVGF